MLLLKKKILLHCFPPIFQFVLEECDDVDDFVKIRISSCLKASISPTAVDEQETLKNLGLGYTMMVCNSGYYRQMASSRTVCARASEKNGLESRR